MFISPSFTARATTPGHAPHLRPDDRRHAGGFPVVHARGAAFPEGIVRLFSRMSRSSRWALPICASSPSAIRFWRSRAAAAITLLQSTGRVMIPFVGSLISVAVNIVLNALLIFGLCGFPALGVQGAAIASLVSAVVGALVIYGAGIAKKTLLRTGRSGLCRHHGRLYPRFRAGQHACHASMKAPGRWAICSTAPSTAIWARARMRRSPSSNPSRI